MLGLLLVALIFLTPFIGFYFLIIKTVDRYEPEPWWLLIVSFLWGAFGATFFALIGNEIGGYAVGQALDLRANDPLLRASTASFVAPLVEESTKGVYLLLLWGVSALWLKEVDGPLDGAIYGGVVGLGFTWVEDALYISSATAQRGGEAFALVFFIRTILAGFGHASFTAMTGLGIGIAAETRNPLLKIIAPIGGWSAAVGLHFLHNFLVSFFGGGGFVMKLLLFWTFDIIFFVLIVVLVVRDRSIVMRGLADEVGRSLHPKELARTTSLWMLLPLWNFFSLMGGPQGYFASRRKQLALIELAFVKHRRGRGESGLERKEAKLRSDIARANQQGVFVGQR